MTLVVVGYGTVGGIVARRWAAAGQDVTVMTRAPLVGLPAGTGWLPLGDVPPGVEAVVVATPFTAVRGVAERLRPRAGILVLDTSNPVRCVGADEPGDTAPDGSRWGPATPAGVTAAAVNGPLFPNAVYVKALSSTPLAMVDAMADADPRLALPYAGPADARVDRLIGQLGYDAVRVGGLDAAASIEIGGRLFGPPRAASQYR